MPMDAKMVLETQLEGRTHQPPTEKAKPLWLFVSATVEKTYRMVTRRI
jgi:hypothetical protein